MTVRLASLPSLLAALFAFAAPADAATIVFLIGEREYDTRETLPAFAADALEPFGHRCVFVHALHSQPNRFPGASLIDEADLLVVSVRRRSMPKDDLARVRRHLESGKPLVAIRTACHAFDPKGEVPDGDDVWRDFDTDVLGARYDNHLKNEQGTTVDPVQANAAHPVLQGVEPQPFHSGGTLYRMYDLIPEAELLANGSAEADGERQTYPVAWVRDRAGSRIFATTLGHESDFAQPSFRRMLANAIAWGLERSTGPVATADPSRSDRLASN